MPKPPISTQSLSPPWSAGCHSCVPLESFVDKRVICLCYVSRWTRWTIATITASASESRQPLPAPSFAPPSVYVHLRRTCLNNSTGRHYAGAEKSPVWPSFINFFSLVLPHLTLASSPLHRRSAVAPCGNHTHLSCPKHIPVNTSTHFSTGHHWFGTLPQQLFRASHVISCRRLRKNLKKIGQHTCTPPNSIQFRKFPKPPRSQHILPSIIQFSPLAFSSSSSIFFSFLLHSSLIFLHTWHIHYSFTHGTGFFISFTVTLSIFLHLESPRLGFSPCWGLH